MTPSYDLTYKPRTQGLTVAGYKLAPLHLRINRSTSSGSTPPKMPHKGYSRFAQTSPSRVGRKVYAGENTNAPPESSSDEDEAATIVPSLFIKKSNSSTPTPKGGKAGTGGGRGTVNRHGTLSSRTAESKISLSSSHGSSTEKRKNPATQEDSVRGTGRVQGKNIVDVYGRVQSKKARKSYKFGSQPRPAPPSAVWKKSGSSPQVPQFQKIELDFDLNENSMASQDPNSSPGEQSLFRPDTIGSSPETLKTPSRFQVPTEFERSPAWTQAAEKVLKKPKQEFSPSSRGGESFEDVGKLQHNSPISTPPSLKELAERSANAAILKRNLKKPLEVKDYGLSRGLAEKIHSIVGEGLGANVDAEIDKELNAPMKVEARCPMCKQPCDVSELNRWGTMNTRQQEKFCRSHRKTNATKRWDSKGYPEIHWDKMDSRLSQHNKFIKTLLQGADCHYRREFEELVAAGKGRSLRKMEANLIPGYYGSHGLNMISAHVVAEFADLLSDRSMDDGLISKRGITAFVQSVIVPEVTVQLVMEDMSIDEAEARNILSDSSNMGELVHEDIRDVVMDQVEDADDDIMEH